MKLNVHYSTSGGDKLLADLHQIIRVHMNKPIKEAKHLIDTTVSAVANKIKLWALENIRYARESNADTTLYKKIINNPTEVAKQLAYNMMDMSAPQEKSSVPTMTEKYSTVPIAGKMPELTDFMSALDGLFS